MRREGEVPQSVLNQENRRSGTQDGDESTTGVPDRQSARRQQHAQPKTEATRSGEPVALELGRVVLVELSIAERRNAANGPSDNGQTSQVEGESHSEHAEFIGSRLAGDNNTEEQVGDACDALISNSDNPPQRRSTMPRSTVQLAGTHDERLRPGSFAVALCRTTASHVATS